MDTNSRELMLFALLSGIACAFAFRIDDSLIGIIFGTLSIGTCLIAVGRSTV